MSRKANFRASFQSTDEAMLQEVLDALKCFDEYVVLATGIKPNTREPYVNGAHATLFFRFPSETEENDE